MLSNVQLIGTDLGDLLQMPADGVRRLAVALGIDVAGYPEHKDLCIAVMAHKIADALGETGAPGQAPRARVEQQIRAMQRAIGHDLYRVHGWLRSAAALHASNPLTRANGARRTLGGAFFAFAREHAYAMAERGTMPWRTFYAAFCWREPTLKAPKPAPVKAPRKERVKQPPKPAAKVIRPHRRGAEPVEVYQARRRA